MALLPILRRPVVRSLLAACLVATACGADAPPPPSITLTTAATGNGIAPDQVPTVPGSANTHGPAPHVVLTEIAAGLDQPVAAASVAGTDLMLVAQRRGRIRVIAAGELLDDPALDLTPLVDSTEAWERGLLGIAVHPSDHRVLLSYTTRPQGDLVVVSYRLSADGVHLDPESAVEILRVDQPGYFHQGGTLHFDDDGYLWAGFGDGGSTPDADGTIVQDRFGEGQNPFSLRGTLVRIDVDRGTPYAVPPDNPFADGADGAPEVWAYGLRNPWSFSFDRGRLFIGDVGHVGYEEINVVDLATGGGANFGWSEWEGPECFEDRPCEDTIAIPPALALRRPELCAIIGGVVYRGTAIPPLTGHFVFGDLCGAWIRSVAANGTSLGEPTTLVDGVGAQITSFATGPDDEIWVTTFEGGVYRLDPAP